MIIWLALNRIEDLYAAVIEGAVQPIRPKIMTVCAIIFGLLPIMWSPVYQAGADVMKRIATPMIGGPRTVLPIGTIYRLP
jgi:copper/silver efflux system protein